MFEICKLSRRVGLGSHRAGFARHALFPHGKLIPMHTNAYRLQLHATHLRVDNGIVHPNLKRQLLSVAHLVVPSQEHDLLWPLDFQRVQQKDDFKAVRGAIDVIANKDPGNAAQQESND